MFRRHNTLRWVLLLLFMLTVLLIYYYLEVKSVRTVIRNIQKEEDFHRQNFAVQAEQWIVVDGTQISNDDLVEFEDIDGWTVLVFGKNVRFFGNRRCRNCLFINDVSLLTENIFPLPFMNIQMMSYLHAISHGAKWIYVTNKIRNLTAQLDGFHTEGRVIGLLYSGQVPFDPDRHFGLRSISENLSVQNQESSYLHGDYATPSVQSKWRPSEQVISDSQISVNDVACRLPSVIVPSQSLPFTDLMGSLVEYTSFWTLGSLLSEPKSSSRAYWWLWLMKELDRTIGIHPQSCRHVSIQPVNNEEVRASKAMDNVPLKWKCGLKDTFFACGISLAEEMVNHHHSTQSDVSLIRNWFRMLTLVKFKEPRRVKLTDKFSVGPVRSVTFQITPDIYIGQEVQNVFTQMCKSNLGLSKKVPPIRDILLVVVFNYPHYSNILHLSFIHHRFFANVVYCGIDLKKFRKLHSENKTQIPVTFLELPVNEFDRGVHGYMCSAYAMEMGFKVSGYLQISDDVLLNMWNIDKLPRDRMWFQNSIRKGHLSASNVPNIETRTKVRGKFWWPWTDKRWGIVRLNETLADFENLTKRSEQDRLKSFLGQLHDNLGNTVPGAYYEASDIFYIPDKYRDNFIFFSKQFVKNRLFLEIAIPTMLGAFDNISTIVRLNGTYLWYTERKHYVRFFNQTHTFLHPVKLSPLMGQEEFCIFFCRSYFPLL